MSASTPFRCWLLLTLPALLARQALGQANAPEDLGRAPETVLEPIDQAICSVDVGQAIFSLGQAGTGLSASITGCQTLETEDEKAGCSTAINFVILSFMFVGSYTSAAASSCALTTNLQAYCSADTFNLVGDLATIAAAGSSMKLTCSTLGTTTPGPDPYARRLGGNQVGSQRETPEMRRFAQEAVNAALKARKIAEASEYKDTPEFQAARKEAMDKSAMVRKMQDEEPPADQTPYTGEDDSEAQLRAVEITDCVLNAGQAAWYMMRASLGIYAATENCVPEATLDEPGKMGCSVDITGLIGSFAWSTSAIAFCVSQCPVGSSIPALCAADVAAIVAAVAGIGTSGSNYMLTCGELAAQAGVGPTLQRRMLADFMGVPPEEARLDMNDKESIKRTLDTLMKMNRTMTEAVERLRSGTSAKQQAIMA